MKPYFVGCLLLVSCAPYLNEHFVVMHAYHSDAKCAQGPFEFHATTLAAPWGQVLRVSWPPSLLAHAQISLDGVVVAEGANAGPKIPNRCELSPLERANVPGTATSAPVSGSNSNLPSASPIAPSTPTLTEVPLPERANNYDFETNCTDSDRAAGIDPVRCARAVVVWKDTEVHSWGDVTRVKASGHDLTITFWADQLEPFDAGTILITQSVQRPSVSDAEYVAYLRTEEAKTIAEQKEKEAEAETSRKKFAIDCEARVKSDDVNGDCRAAGYRNARGATGTPFSLDCEARVRRNDVNRACRVAGYENEKTTAARTREAASPTVYATASPSSSGEIKPQKHDPDGPPPPPRAETETPQPSAHAEWIPGSWTWNGLGWEWLSGGWNVPESDITSKQTATAPSVPPSAQVEIVPPPPTSNVVWVSGYWHYRGGWIWVPGRYALPPSREVTWHSAGWINEGGRVRLDPGRWVRR